MFASGKRENNVSDGGGHGPTSTFVTAVCFSTFLPRQADVLPMTPFGPLRAVGILGLMAWATKSVEGLRRICFDGKVRGGNEGRDDKGENGIRIRGGKTCEVKRPVRS